MPLGRKIAFACVVLSALVPSILPSAHAQERLGTTYQANSGDGAFRNWLSTFERTGAKIEQVASRYNAATGTLDIQGLSITWPAASEADASLGAIELSVGDLTLKSLQSDDQGVKFASLLMRNVKLQAPISPQSNFSIASFTAENGVLPSFASFVADPSKPFTTQIRLMRLLAGASVDNASAQTISIGNSTFAASANLKGLSGAKVRVLELKDVRTRNAPNEGELATSEATVGVATISNVDFDSYLRLFEPSAYLDRGSTRPWVNMIDALELRSLNVKNGSISVDVMSARAGPLKLKQFSENISDIFDRAAVDPGYLASNTGSAAKLANSIRDAFALETLSGEAIVIAGQNQSGPVKAVLAGAEMTNFTAKSISQINVHGLDITDATGQVKLATLNVDGVNLVPVRSDVGKTTRSGGDMVEDTIVPTIASVGAEGLSLRLEGISASLDQFELSMAYFIGVTPTNVKLKLGHIKFLTSQLANQAFRQGLIDLGYENVDISVNFSGFWDDSSSSVLVEDLTVVGAQMGTLSLSGALAGITRAGIESPTGILPLDIEKSGIKNVRLSFQNDTLFDRFIGRIAQANGKSVDEIKKLLSGNLPSIFSGINPDDLRNKFIFSAIAFLNTPQVLTLGATPTSVVPLQDVVAQLKDPAKLPGLLNIEASANNRR